MRRKILYELNSTGKYYAFKEQLKRAVVKVVREKFLKTSTIINQEERQQFLSNLYVFLSNHMHEWFVYLWIVLCFLSSSLSQLAQVFQFWLH